MAEIFFITGTDTGSGKTVLTALLTAHLQQRGISVIAAKPFCSGGQGDALLLAQIQQGRVPLSDIAPFCFTAPIAPLLAARAEKRVVPLLQVRDHLMTLASRCDVLLVEGAGGLLAPLGEPSLDPNTSPYNLLSIIRLVPGSAIISAINKLGVVNHVLLTLAALETSDLPASAIPTSIALMNLPGADPSSASNPALVRELASHVQVHEIACIQEPSSPESIHAAAKAFANPLATLLRRNEQSYQNQEPTP